MLQVCARDAKIWMLNVYYKKFNVYRLKNVRIWSFFRRRGVVIMTIAQLHSWTHVRCTRCVGDLRLWESPTIVPAGIKPKPIQYKQFIINIVSIIIFWSVFFRVRTEFGFRPNKEKYGLENSSCLNTYTVVFKAERAGEWVT